MEMIETLEMILAQRDRERTLPMIGSKDRPYELVVPGWLEDRYVALGTTAQEQADLMFLPHVKVVVVR
jgi:hypothetical protein